MPLKLRPIAVILLFVAFTALCKLTAWATDSPYGALSDQDDQLSLASVLQNDADGGHEMEEALRTRPPFDVAAAYADGTLADKIKATPPLVALKRQAPTGPSSDKILKSPKAYVAPGDVWTRDNSSAFNSAQGKRVISVCWRNATAGNSRGRSLTQIAVGSTWEYHGIAQFIGWNDCEPDSKGIKIKIDDVRPGSLIGIQSEASFGDSMILNFTFNDSEMAGCKQTADNCILSIAIHEFGHALGYLHEQDSPELPLWCRKKLDPNDIQVADAALKAKMLTDWDEFSVMDYCFDIYKTRLQLSDCDIAGYHKLYPPNDVVPPPPYSPQCETR